MGRSLPLLAPHFADPKLAEAQLAKAQSAKAQSPPLQFEPVRPRDRQCRPVVAVWELTLLCDLDCSHCGSRAGRARPDELDVEQCLDVSQQLIDFGVTEVSLIGGEAYLHPGWLLVIERLARAGVDVAMVSGGYNLHAGRVRAAQDAGLRSISISIDGIGAVHSELRGRKDAFERALRAAAAVQEAGLSLSVNSQLNRKNWHQLEDLAALVQQLGARAWQYALTVAMGRAVDNWELLFQPYDLLELFPRLAGLSERMRERGVRVYPGNNVGYFGPHEAALRGSMPRGHSEGCQAARRGLGIEADGTIKGCPSLDTAHYGAGSLASHRLQELWEGSRVMQHTRDGAELWGYCKECYYAKDCGGGCAWTSSVLFGKAGNNPYCFHRAERLAARGLYEHLVRAEAAPGRPFDTGLFRLEALPDRSPLAAP